MKKLLNSNCFLLALGSHFFFLGYLHYYCTCADACKKLPRIITLPFLQLFEAAQVLHLLKILAPRILVGEINLSALQRRRVKKARQDFFLCVCAKLIAACVRTTNLGAWQCVFRLRRRRRQFSSSRCQGEGRGRPIVWVVFAMQNQPTPPLQQLVIF